MSDHEDDGPEIIEVDPLPPSTAPPPPGFNELRRLSRHPTSAPPPSRGGPRRIDSRSSTLPAPHAVPMLLVDPGDLVWFDLADATRAVAELVDGVRSVSLIAQEGKVAPGEVQLRIADLRDRGLVSLQ